ncbi:MAG: hypothetical protein M3Z40_08490, partial [Bifidobacterium sp.]|nr:hypothetical protein [Bifidobacterium sp.]
MFLTFSVALLCTFCQVTHTQKAMDDVGKNGSCTMFVGRRAMTIDPATAQTIVDNLKDVIEYNI